MRREGREEVARKTEDEGHSNSKRGRRKGNSGADAKLKARTRGNNFAEVHYIQGCLYKARGACYSKRSTMTGQEPGHVLSVLQMSNKPLVAPHALLTD